MRAPRIAARTAAVLSCVLVGLGSACLDFRAVAKNPLSQAITIEKEMEIGHGIHQQIRAQGVLITDPILLDYVNALGQRIVAVTEPQPFIYRFNVLEVPGLNAFAVPGGYIYLHQDVLARAGNFAELAGVLAHEVAHVRKRHIAKSREGEGIKTLATLLAIALSGGDPAVAMIATGINVTMQIKHTREAEAEADREGIAYMISAGLDPVGMGRFFERIQTGLRPGADIPPYLFTHPAIPERIASSKVEIRRLNPPADLQTEDDALIAMQERLTALLQPVAGGTGLQARATFDRALTDPLLDQARRARESGALDEAKTALARAQLREPHDPRVPLARADLAEEEGDLSEAELHLRRAFELDPAVPLVQYRIGVIHKRLGNRSRAVFYLEQAAASFSAGSSGQRRAEFEIQSLSFPLLQGSGLRSERREDANRFSSGERVTWWGEISRRFGDEPPRLEVTWLDPGDVVVFEEQIEMQSLRRVWSTFDTSQALAGQWTIRVRAGEMVVDERKFQIYEPGAGS